MVDLIAIIKIAPLAISIAQYLGLIEDRLGLQLDKLTSSELDSALRALRQAANSENEADSLLREARMRFNKAISLESGLRLAAAYLGLALCHGRLGDIVNAREALGALEGIEIPPPSTVLEAAAMLEKMPWSMTWGVAMYLAPLLILMPIPLIAKLLSPAAARAVQSHRDNIAKLRQLQNDAKSALATA